MVRALVIGSAATVVAALLGGPLIDVLRRLGIGKAISAEGPQSHQAKAGTPTMGGLLFLSVIAVFTATTNLVDKLSILLPLGVMGATGAIGVLDDLRTIQGRSSGTGHEREWQFAKEGALLVVGLGTGLVLYFSLDIREMHVPHLGSYDIGWAYIPLAVVVMAGTTSASGFTDGLDGLLGGLMALAFGAYGVIAFAQGQTYLAVFCFTVVGALGGFLWHNAHPARVFMGDTGSLPLGAGLATVALMTGWWVLLPVVGVMLVIEGLSVVGQVASFRLLGFRILRMAPVHHHFELTGWPETRIVLRFWLIGLVGALIGVALALTD